MYDLDLEAWQPDESQRGAIIHELRSWYESTLDLCGGEEAEDAKQLLKKVMTHPLRECRDDIQEYFLSMYDAIDGELSLISESEPKLVELIQMILRPADIIVTPQEKSLQEGIELLMGYGMTVEMASAAMEQIASIIIDAVINTVEDSLRKSLLPTK